MHHHGHAARRRHHAYVSGVTILHRSHGLRLGFQCEALRGVAAFRPMARTPIA